MKEGINANTISYKEFRMNRNVPPGTVVTGVKPSDLFTTQTWVCPKKAEKALSKTPDDPTRLTSEGYLYRLGSGSTKIALGDGNHRTLAAWETGERVNVEVKGELPPGTKAIPLGALRKNYGDLFRR